MGMTEEEAKEAGLNYFVGQSFFRGNARARCQAETDGFVKVIGEKITGRLEGMHILGPHASEMIGEGVVAFRTRRTVNRWHILLTHILPYRKQLWKRATLQLALPYMDKIFEQDGQILAPRTLIATPNLN